MPTTSVNATAVEAADPRLALCSGVRPVWSRQLAASRVQSELAVSEMMQAFASIGPHLQLAQRQSQDITAALSQGDGRIGGLAQSCEAALAPWRAAALPAEAAAAMETVLGLVREAVTAIEQINRPFAQETQVVAEQVERMYIGFQYQDRISQMLALLEGDMARLQDAFAPGAEVPQLAAWLERLQAQYAMAEQRHSHGGAGDAQPGADDNETTFF